jgi:hypothetical protein
MGDDERADLEQVEFLHREAKACQRRLEWLHNLSIRFVSLTPEQRRQNALYPNFIAPLVEVKEWLNKDPAALTYLALMTETRSRLGLLKISLGTVRPANAHELALQAALYFIRIWNQTVRPDLPDISPNPHAEDWNIAIQPPPSSIEPHWVIAFLVAVESSFTTFNPRELDAELKLEYAAAADMLHERWAGHNPEAAPCTLPVIDQCEVKREGEVWRLQYKGESASYPTRGNKCIAWLARLLAAPNRALTVADLQGDPDRKLAADARIGSERETDPQGVAAIKSRIEEIDDITSETGGSEGLEEEKAQLLVALERTPGAKSLASQLKRAHANMATQLRNLRRDKLTRDMPQFAAHLVASLKMDLPEFGYYPPHPAPTWHF